MRFIAFLCCCFAMFGCSDVVGDPPLGCGGQGGMGGALPSGCHDGLCDGQPSDDCRKKYCGADKCEYVNADNGTPCEPSEPSEPSGTGGAGGSGGGTTTEPGCAFVSQCDPYDGPSANKTICDDGFDKTLDRCIPVPGIGGVCAHVGAQCDYLDPIEVQQHVCDDGNPCTTDRCMEQNACSNWLLNDGAECPGGTCVGGACLG